MNAHRLVALALFALPLLVTMSCGGGGKDTRPHVWEPYELTIDTPVDMANPFDPAQADLPVKFIAPSGKEIDANAFVTRNYTRKLVDKKEQLTPKGGLQWKVRFTPTEPGDWTWTWSLLRGQDRTTGPAQTLHVEPARANDHGFLRVSPDDNRYLRFEDGAPYFAIGENLAWYDDGGTFDYDTWFDKLQARGVNYVRLWMPSWAFGLEWMDPNTLGNYTQRLDRAWQLDYVLEQARRRGIYVLLCIQNHGPFSAVANSEWDKNPYNAANGGPLTDPAQVFTNAEAKQLFGRRLRYIVARWGADPSLLGWELWNEVDLTGGNIDDIIAWHDAMSTELRELDPYDHLISTSTSLPWGIAAVSATDLTSYDSSLFRFWQLKNIDFSQVHLYALGGSSIDFSALMPSISENLRRFAKPVLLAEAGVNAQGPKETIAADPGGQGFHDMLWAGLFSETMGTGMSWWWDNVVDPQDWYYHFAPVARLTKGVPFDKEVFAASGGSAAAPDKELEAFTLTGKTVALAWVKNPTNDWFSPDKTPINGATLTLQHVPAGTWHATWLNTYANKTVSQADVQASGKPLVLVVPSFQRDIALRLDKK